MDAYVEELKDNIPVVVFEKDEYFLDINNCIQTTTYQVPFLFPLHQ